MKTEIKGPLVAVVVVIVLIGVGLAAYFTLFNERKVTPEEMLKHMGGGARPAQGAPGAHVGSGGAPAPPRGSGG